MAAAIASASVLAIEFAKCEHISAARHMKCIPHCTTPSQLFEEYHPLIDHKTHTLECFARSTLDGGVSYKVSENLPMSEFVSSFGVKVLSFSCKALQLPKAHAAIHIAAEEATSKAVDAFQVLMSRGREFPKKRKTSSGMRDGINHKDGLYNDLVDLCEQKGLDFPKDTADQDGGYFLQTLCNAVWYITNQIGTIEETSRHKKGVTPVPDPFDQFTGYNDCKRKKIKCQPLSSSTLKGHAGALFSLLDKPYTNCSRGKWVEVHKSIESLAACLSSYAEYLDKKADASHVTKNLPAPPRTVDMNASVLHCKKSVFLSERYALLDKVVSSSEVGTPTLFCEASHVDKPFENSMQRQRFFQQLRLSVPVDLIKYTPGGGVGTTFVIVQVAQNRSEAEMMTSAARLVQTMRPQLKEYHTRHQKRLFKLKVANIAKVSPALVDFIYSELALDASAASNPDVQHRIRLISLGECGLISDLRHLNPGRPADTYDVFFQRLCEKVEDISAADDRRHGEGVAHLSKWISLSDMIDETAKSCPEGTSIPSKSLVRLQFMPTNPYTQTALRFTSKVPIQYKIQRRQLRSQHQDDHYCAALFKYLKCKAVELRNEAMLFCSDDKAKVPIGEPNKPVSTGVRGRASIAPAATELSSLDHDMNMASLTPSVILKCSVGENPQKSFVRGQVTTVINDSVTQSASPFRHAVHLKKIVEKADSMPSILLKYTDGGTDQRNTLESVKCANICLFRELNLDLLVAARCAPGQSYVNPAERIMSILNYGLQNVATERQELDEADEKLLKSCGSMASIREAIKKKPELETKWKRSIAPVQSLIRSRFLKLKLKEEPVQCMDPVDALEIDVLQRHLRELFPDLDIQKLQKVHTNKCAAYLEWKERHCRETQYTFQIRKCEEGGCCAPIEVQDKEKLQWLPEPTLDESGEHFQPYDLVRDKETDERDRPSLKVQKSTKTPEKKKGVNIVNEPDNNQENDNLKNVALSGQNARATAVCVECNKPRVVYSNIKLSSRKQMTLAVTLSEYEYTCGSSLFPPSAAADLRQTVVVRPSLQCAAPVEVPYYVGELGRRDICAFCGQPEAETDPELKKSYKTVLPICQGCRRDGKTPIVQRKFGK